MFILGSLPSAGYQSVPARVRRPWMPTWFELLAIAVCSRLWLFRTGIQRSLLPPISVLGSALGYASPAVRLRVCGVVVTYSVRISGGGIDSFLGFEYGVVITLASRELRVLLPILPTNLRFFAHFWLRRGRMMLRPHLYCLTSRFTHVQSLYWVFRLMWRSSGLRLSWHRSLCRLQRRFFC